MAMPFRPWSRYFLIGLIITVISYVLAFTLWPFITGATGMLGAVGALLALLLSIMVTGFVAVFAVGAIK